VNETDSVKAVKVGLLLFYKMMGFGDATEIIEFPEIRKQMYHAVNRGRLFRPTTKRKDK